MKPFKVIIVEDMPLELKGTEGILRNEIPEAEIIGTATDEDAYWTLINASLPELVLLDLGLSGFTMAGVEICRKTKNKYPSVRVLVFTGETLNERLWVNVLDAGADGIVLKTGEMLTRRDILTVMDGKSMVFNQPMLERIVSRFKQCVYDGIAKQEAMVHYETDEYDERLLRHLALGYTKEQIASLRGMPFGVKSLEKRQSELVQKLFPEVNKIVGNRVQGPESTKTINATRLVVRAIQVGLLDIDNLVADEW